MSLEKWTDIVRICQDEYPWSWVFFIPFVCFTNYTLLNLVTAVVVENVLVISQKEQRQEAKLEDTRRLENISQLKALFDEMDSGGDGELDRDEFETAIAEPS